MCDYSFSPKHNAFYSNKLREIHYEPAGAWPADAVEIDDGIAAAYMTTAIPLGKMLGSVDGMPAWVETPPLTIRELQDMAEDKRLALLKHVDEITADWRTELALGEISEVNKRQLSEWMAYKRELKAMEITSATEITWPIQPEI